ncbi:NifB/NifX family molybdenum-iron cluster-binding protein [Geobacter pickeringii]|uniref:NifB/NifX family molybdenum-iron cluster-binding protein n=1 Tax=Geobacter pickeringii TaxID=345632 RepID=UPI00068A3916|nr:NifB/NifX family molybdenum-iron cluster-binding protein [Geobacter pickeringii]
MEKKLAVASSDGNRIDEHFGRARRFRVYRFEGGNWLYEEDREGLPPCAGGAHSDDLLDQAVDRVADCRWVVVSQIGPGAIDALIARRVLPLVLKGTVDEALTLVGKRYLGTANTT